MLEDERRASLCIVYDVRYGNDDKRNGGGQLSAFEDEICVSIYMVKKVAEYYYQLQDMYDKRNWKKE